MVCGCAWLAEGAIKHTAAISILPFCKFSSERVPVIIMDGLVCFPVGVKKKKEKKRPTKRKIVSWLLLFFFIYPIPRAARWFDSLFAKE